MLQKLKHITLFASLIVSGAMAATLEDIKYDPKSNGLMLSIEFSEPIPDDNIIAKDNTNMTIAIKDLFLLQEDHHKENYLPQQKYDLFLRWIKPYT